jgi:hypothetical protein
MKNKNKYVVRAAAMACSLALAAHAAESDKERQQKEIQNMAQDTLSSFTKPSQRPREWSMARQVTQSSAIWE